MAKRLLIKNIKQLVQVEDQDKPLMQKVSGPAMKRLACIDDAWLAAEDGIIVDYGKMEDWPGITDWRDLEILDASGQLVLPCWCDSHTHLVYAGTREGEFVDRINGLTYEEIAARGGGILNSAKKLETAGEDELYDAAMERLDAMIKMGTGAVEIKSGYGLTLENELKMLRVIKRIKDTAPIPVKATFLGAHALPSEYKNNRDAYIDMLINTWIPEVAKLKLADYADVFCEQNYFTPEETVRILEAGKKHGLKPKVHANQLSRSGGVQAGVQTGARSVDHLEFVEEEEIALLLNSDTIPTVLPGAAFFLKLPLPPARKMIDAGLPVAIATDFNPGSSPSGNMNFLLSLLCVQYGLNPEEAINAATINGACAMDLQNVCGSIATGKIANLIITRPVSGYSFIPYSFAMDCIDKVIINGEIYS